MLCSKFLALKEKEINWLKGLNIFFEKLDRNYKRMLTWTLSHRLKVLISSLVIVLASSLLFSKIEKTLVPEQDESRFIVRFKTPLGSNIEYTYNKLLEVEEIINQYNDYTASVFSSIGLGSRGQVNKGFISIRLKEKDNRSLSQAEIMAKMRLDFNKLAGVKAFASGVSFAGGRRSEKLQFSITGPSIDKVAALSDELLIKLSENEGLGSIDLNLQLNLPQMILNIDRERASSFGITASQIAESISVLSNGLDVARFNDEPGDGRRYDIRLKAKEGSFEQLNDLNKIYLRSESGDLVRLDTIASFNQELGPAVIGRQDLQLSLIHI